MPTATARGAGHAALVTGASSGIGLALCEMLADEGHALTMTARTPEKLERAAAAVSARGVEVMTVVANVALADDVERVVRLHRERFGRLDVLVNNAGMGVRGGIEGYETKWIDLQLAVNVRAVMLFYREGLDMLRAAGREHRNALVVNTSSIAGKEGHPELGVYSATKHGVVGFTASMNRELSLAGIKSCVLCPGLVDTALADYMKERVPADEMIRPEDVAMTVRTLLHLSPHCIVPEILFMRPGAEPALPN
jgi:NAD(P)-dependent dehydrogenase (short-subunit alcohol dehydrogenase family)